MIDSEFLKLLACPACKSPLAIQGDMLQCQNETSCGLLYRVEDKIPVLLVEESVAPSQEAPDSDEDPS